MDKDNESYLLSALLVVTSGLIWCGVWVANKYLMVDAAYAQGIGLVYLPAGFRLLIVLVCGVWGALGIALFNPLLFLNEFRNGNATELVINSLISGFVPYLTMRAFCRAGGISSSLVNIRPLHLPLLALAVSVVNPLFYNIEFVLFGHARWHDFGHNLAAMALGDFAGCFLVVGFARIVLSVRRLAV